RAASSNRGSRAAATAPSLRGRRGFVNRVDRCSEGLGACETGAVELDGDAKDERGPFTVGLGGALGVAGSILPWAVVKFQPGPFGVIPSRLFTPIRHVMGTRTTEGKITVVVALAVALFGIAALLVRRRDVHTAVGVSSAVG